jgi:DNA repair protein RecN (Recombination protein N)
LLLELNISNFAIIDRLNLQLDPGFNAITGETGAGKSTIVDALGILLGDKPDTTQIRSGEEQAHIEGVFDVSGLRTEHEVRRLLEDYGIALGDEMVILSRDINATGRSISRVNGRVVNADFLQDIGHRLVDIHGQSQHLSLLRVSRHLDFLDTYAGLIPKRDAVGELVGDLRQVRKELVSLRLDEREVARRTDLLQYQVDEITGAKLHEGEDEAIEQEVKVLASAERLMRLADSAYQSVYGGMEDGKKRAVLDTLSEVQRNLSEVSSLDSRVSPQLDELSEAVALLEDVAISLRSYRDSVESNPAKLQKLDDRLNMIKDLKRKYGGTIAEIIEFGAKAADELTAISHNEERILELQEREKFLLAKIAADGAELSTLRQKSAIRLSAEVDKSLKDLNMGSTHFEVSLVRQEAADGVELDGRKVAFDARGIDKAEFMVSTNVGEPLRPLVKVASGGETSRLMLALKSVLSAVDETPTLVFDEIDVGVGGRSGQVVGEKLCSLSNIHQVVTITHLPQIACFSDAHFQIRKQVKGDRTVTEVVRLGDEDRLRELAAMLEGNPDSDLGVESARRMVGKARTWRLQHLPQKEHCHCAPE